MNKKELTKKQLRGRLTTITESKSTIKSELKKAYMSLKNLKSLLIGHKTGDQTLSFSDLKKIKTAARHIEDIYEDMTDEEMTDKEEKKSKEVEKKNEQSEGHGKMYNALSSIKEGKVIKMSESTLRKVVERVITEQNELETEMGVDPVKNILGQSVSNRTQEKRNKTLSTIVTQKYLEGYMDGKFEEVMIDLNEIKEMLK